MRIKMERLDETAKQLERLANLIYKLKTRYEVVIDADSGERLIKAMCELDKALNSAPFTREID